MTRISAPAVAGLLTIFLMAACSHKPPPTGQPPGKTLWPQPPATPRYIHEASLRFREDIQAPDNERRVRSMVLGPQAMMRAFARPYDVASNYGRIYVSDIESALISVFDVPRRRFYRFGGRPEGRLIQPMGLALDARSNLYVADVGSRRVQVFDFLGLHLRTIGTANELQRPVSVAVDRDSGLVYVVDNGGIDSPQHRVVVYDSDGRLRRVLGARGDGPGQFNLPTDAVVGDDGTLYVLDSGNFRVQMFDSSGKFLGQWGSVGNGFGQFARPRSIAVDSQGHLYITDMFFGNFQVFNRHGDLLLPVGSIDDNNLPGRFRLISGISVDETQRIYVTDQLFRKVEVFRLLSEKEGRTLAREWAKQQ